MTSLDFGEDLPLLRWALPPLGASMAIAGVFGWTTDQLRPLAAVTLVGLGVLAALWSLRVVTRRIRFDGLARRVHVTTRRGVRACDDRVLRFEDVRNVVLRVLGGARRTTDSPLGGDLQLALILVTDDGEFPLSRLAESSLADCEAQDASIWKMLERTPPEALLARSYRQAIARRDRLQAIWLARLSTPGASLDEAEGRVRRDWAQS